MAHFVFATCRTQPDLQPSDALLAEALARRGQQVTHAAWNGSFAPFVSAGVVVARSTWDYHEHPETFGEWLDALDSAPGTVVNTPALMRWNQRKTYLFDLAERGAPIAPTRLADPDPGSIGAALDALGLDAGIVKPIVGAGASGLSMVPRDDAGELQRAAEKLGRHQALVQPLVPSIRTFGEMSLMFIEGKLTHAVVKRPRADSILVQSEHGGATSRIQPDPDWIEVARRTLGLLPEPALYARVDLVEFEGRPVLMEVELIEPELFFPHAVEAADEFAAVLSRTAPPTD